MAQKEKLNLRVTRDVFDVLDAISEESGDIGRPSALELLARWYQATKTDKGLIEDIRASLPRDGRIKHGRRIGVRKKKSKKRSK